MQDYHRLEVWQRAMDFTVCVYEFVALLPASERFNLGDQLRTAATSVPLNIAEASGCATTAEFCRFLGYAYRSMKEVMTALELCERLFAGAVAGRVSGLLNEGDQVSRMMRRLLQKAESSASQNSPLTTHDSRLPRHAHAVPHPSATSEEMRTAETGQKY